MPRARPDVTFRVASGTDVGPVVALVESAYRGEASRAGWTTEADLLDGQRTDEAAVAELVSAEGSLLLLAESPAATPTLVGCCHLAHHGDGAAHLGLFAVRPGRQGGGIGRALVDEAEGRVRRQWGADRMVLHVIRQREDLIAWYRRLGYEASGSFAPFPYGDERFGIPRRADLEFAVLVKALPEPDAER